MTAHTEKLVGRLALLDPLTLSAAQKEIYDRISATFVSWSDRINFQSATDDGRLIGPFNPILFSPGISSSCLDLHDAEEERTSLDERVRQVVILAVGAVWRSDYELYAHSAAARKAEGRYFRERNPGPRGRRPAGRPQRAGEGRSTLRTPIFS